MLRENVEGTPKYDEVGIAERLQLGWVPDREPDIRDRGGRAVKTAWVQERENQLALLDTCFGALQPEESLCFFYAKRTPMSEQSRRVIVGVGRVLSVGEGHTLLPRIWIIRRARERALQPPCPLGENVLDASEERFDPVIVRVATGPGERAYQLDRLVQCRAIIRREALSRKKGKPHTAEHDWRKHVDKGLDTPLPHVPAEREMEVLARTEKAVALEQLFRSRLCVLVGSAGTGKTTLLRMLCSMPGLAENGLLLLAPTGKARVRLEEQTKMRGAGQTLAQFLIHYQRYDGRTGAYFPNRRAPRCGEYRTVIVDECSMLTEEQLAALIDSLTNVERLVLVGDPRQLPPIGAGRPFVDIVKEVKPADIEERDPIYVETFIPRCGPSYAELTINQRQQGETRADRLLASHFSGLHQGSLAEYRRYAGDENSEIARRLTNLFTSPIPGFHNHGSRAWHDLLLGASRTARRPGLSVSMGAKTRGVFGGRNQAPRGRGRHGRHAHRNTRASGFSGDRIGHRRGDPRLMTGSPATTIETIEAFGDCLQPPGLDPPSRLDASARSPYDSCCPDATSESRRIRSGQHQQRNRNDRRRLH